jgi:hypothetical protein
VLTLGILNAAPVVNSKLMFEECYLIYVVTHLRTDGIIFHEL